MTLPSIASTMLGFGKKDVAPPAAPPVEEVDAERNAPRKTWGQTMMPIFACGSGLFSDGYINNVRDALILLFYSHLCR